MPMIEGFGDEVTYAMMVLLAIIVITACWISTQHRSIPFVNVFILESLHDIVDTNITHGDIIVPVAQVPVEASPPRDNAPQPSQSDNTEGLNTEAEPLKNEGETSLSEDQQQEEDGEKSSPEEQPQTSTKNGNANSSETQDTAEASSEDGNSSLTAENVAYLETQTTARKVNIRLIYMNNTQRTVQARLTDTIGDFRRLHFEKELSENKTIRFIFHGKSLGNDRSTLESYNVKRNSVIHCLVTPSLRPRHTEEMVPNPTAPSPNANSDSGQDMSLKLVLYPSIFIICVVLSYLQFTSEQALRTPCIMSILGASTFMLVVCIAIYRTMRIRAVHRAV